MGHKEQNDLAELFDIKKADSRVLMLYNDDYNYFEFVIESLIKICKHTTEQASQCALTVHLKGKCDVKAGDYDQLSPMKEALITRGLNAVIE